jgi:prepilin-type N-terminal cleavage/methylation domain-containing protein
MGRSESGVTLMELLIVVAIAGAMATLVLPAFSSGLDNLRLAQASDSVAAFLNGALNRAERRQQVIEVSVAPRENAIAMRSADNVFVRKLDLPDGVHIDGEPRQLLLLPGSVFPRFGVQLSNRRGQRRLVTIDPITGVPNIDKL